MDQQINSMVCLTVSTDILTGFMPSSKQYTHRALHPNVGNIVYISAKSKLPIIGIETGGRELLLYY